MVIKNLENSIHSLVDGEEKIEALIALSKNISVDDASRALQLLDEALVVSRKIESRKGVADCLVGVVKLKQGEIKFDTIIQMLIEALDLYKSLNDLEGELVVLNSFGNYYSLERQHDKAFEYLFEAKQKIISNSQASVGNQIQTNINIGHAYARSQKHESAIEYYSLGAKLSEGSGNELILAHTLSNLGGCYYTTKEYDKALAFFSKALSIGEKNNFVRIVILTLNSLANVYHDLKNFDQAIDCYDRSILLNNNMYEVSRFFSLKGKANTLIEKKRPREAIVLLEDALQISTNGNYESELEYIFLFLSNAYALNEEYKLAWEYSLKHREALNKKREKEQSERILELEKMSLRQETEIERLKNVELKEANREIVSSIEYAKHLQRAFQISNERMKKILPNSFGVFNPKDIVSGDFYWAAEISEGSLVAAADCTGHGIPGAIMTIINKNLLDDAVEKKKLSIPCEILEDVHKSLLSKVGQNKSESNPMVRDGMDIALCLFNLDKSELQYAGANRPLYLVRDGILYEYSSTKASIGGHSAYDQVFINNKIKIFKDDMFYIFSDGYADQFGGEKDKKFTTKRFKELLVSVSKKSLDDQRRILTSTIENWTIGERPQTDDILVIGIRV